MRVEPGAHPNEVELAPEGPGEATVTVSVQGKLAGVSITVEGKPGRKITHLAALASIALASLTGCGPRFDHLEFVQSTSPPLPVTLERTGVIVPVGIAVACTPIAIDGADPDRGRHRRS